MSTSRSVEETKWSSEGGKMKGNSEEARSINRHLDLLKIKIIDAQMELLHKNLPITVSSLKSKIFGIEENKRMLIPIF
jgi:hypothetical protein